MSDLTETTPTRHEAPDVAELRRRLAALPGFSLKHLHGGPGGESYIGLDDEGGMPLSDSGFDAVLLFAEIAALEVPRLLAAAEERDEIADRLAHLLCDLTGGRMSKTSYPVPVMEQEIEQYLSECHESDLKDERDALAEWRDFSEAEIAALRSMLDGRCLSDITHRDEEHRQSVCMLPEGHAPLAHDDCMGCTWTDADHWQPSAVDRVADEVQRIADESKHEGWDGPLVRILVGRVGAALDGDCHE